MADYLNSNVQASIYGSHVHRRRREARDSRDRDGNKKNKHRNTKDFLYLTVNKKRQERKYLLRSNEEWPLQFEEQEPIIIGPEEYTTTALVMWIDGEIGEVICERNLQRANLHFFFTRTTQIQLSIDNSPASADLKATDLLIAGVQVEITVHYLPLRLFNCLEHQMVHIDTMSICKPVARLVNGVVSVSAVCNTPTELTVATSYGGERVLVHPTVFTADLIKQFVSTCTIYGPEDMVLAEQATYNAMDRTLFARRTITGDMVPVPYWVVDVIGGYSWARHIMLNCRLYDKLIQGYGIVTHVIPRLAIVIQWEYNHEEIFYPIISITVSMKIKLAKGTRVRFAACREVPGHTYLYRALLVEPAKSVDLISFSCDTSSLSTINKSLEQQKTHLLDQDIHEVNANDEELTDDDDMTSSSDEDSSETSQPSSPPSFPEDCGPGSVWETEPLDRSTLPHYESKIGKNLSKTVPKDSSDDEPEDYWTEKLGCVPKNIDEDELVERCERVDTVGEFKYGDEPYCRLVSEAMIEKRKKERKKNARTTSDASSISAQHSKSKKISSRTVIVKEKERLLIDFSDELVPSCEKEEESNVAAAELPQPLKKVAVDKSPMLKYVSPAKHFRVIGLYDDVGLIMEQHLRNVRIAKPPPAAAQHVGPPPQQIQGDGFWFRRHTARVLPTVIVAEFIEKRNDDIDMMDIDLHHLKETVVVRNENPLPYSAVKPPKYRYKPVPTTAEEKVKLPVAELDESDDSLSTLVI